MAGIKKYSYYVYILTNKINTVLYIGVTNNLIKRVYQHKTKVVTGFTEKYNVSKLVYYEIYNDINTAVTREKQLKGWNRNWKIRLIEKENKDWQDLYGSII